MLRKNIEKIILTKDLQPMDGIIIPLLSTKVVGIIGSEDAIAV